MERYLLLHVPSVLLGGLFVVIGVGVSVAGLWVVNRSRELETFESHNDVAGFIIAVVGVLYAVVLAFVVIIVWERFDEASAFADREADLAVTLYRDAEVFEGHTATVRGALRDYARSVVDDEWPSMASLRGDSQRTDQRLATILRAYRAFESTTPEQLVFFSESIERLDDLTQARSERVVASSTALPTPLWALLLAGAAITIGFTYFFGVSSFRAHGLMVGALAAIIALTLFLIVSLDLPFSGDVAVDSVAMQDALREFGHVDAGADGVRN